MSNASPIWTDLRRSRCDAAVHAGRTARGDIVGQTASALRRPPAAADQFLDELLDVVERSERLEVVRAREDDGVGGVTDPPLLEIVELAGPRSATVLVTRAYAQERSVVMTVDSLVWCSLYDRAVGGPSRPSDP